MPIAILGCGTLGEALLRGWTAAGAVTAEELVVTARRKERADELRARHPVPVLLDNLAAATMADACFLCVKPQAAAATLQPLGPALAGKLLVSACAGVRLEQLQRLAPDARLLRAMPNTPVLIREGMTVLAPGPGATDDDVDWVRGLFAVVGRCLVLDESRMDAVTGLSASGPAFAYVMLESLADGGVMMGLPRAAALELAAQTMQGAARMVLAGEGHPAALKDEVTTPAGCTIAGLLTLEDGRIRSTLARAIQEATRVAGQLG